MPHWGSKFLRIKSMTCNDAIRAAVGLRTEYPTGFRPVAKLTCTKSTPPETQKGAARAPFVLRGLEKSAGHQDLAGARQRNGDRDDIFGRQEATFVERQFLRIDQSVM